MRAALLIALPVLLAPAQDLLEVRVDRRFELMSIVFRLADFQEYRMGGIEDYNAAVDAHFGAFKDHAAVKLARELRSQLGYDAIPSLALRVVDARTFRPALDLKAPATGLDARWKPEVASKFLDAMAAFARDTRSEAFFTAQAPFYEKLVQGCRQGLVRHLDQAWFTRTFGRRDRDTFTLGVAPLNGGGNYGPHVPNQRKGQDLFALIGTPRAAAGQVPDFPETYLPTLVHEFLHSFANPWVERHLPELQASGEALNAPVAELMRRQAYGKGETALKESLVRAFTIRYFRDHGNAKTADAEGQRDGERGFYWVRPLAQLLGEYGEQRVRYRDLEAFSPRLVEAFQGWAVQAETMSAEAVKAENARLEQLYAAGPRLVSLEPAPGAKDVDPASSLLRLTFDRPMAGGMAVVRTNDPFPEMQGKGQWDAEGKVLSFTVRLKPATTYGFWLNATGFIGFRDREGRPLRPTQVTFTTRQ